MKYLRIHKILWFGIVVLYTAIEGLFWFVGWIIATFWTLRVTSFPWSYLHSAESDRLNTWGGYSYCDRTPWETVWRRYTETFRASE